LKKIIALIAVCACVFSSCKNEMPTTRVGNGGVSDKNKTTVSSNSNTEKTIANSVNLSESSVLSQAQTSATEQQTTPEYDGEVIEIKEKMFVAQSNDIWYNAEEYMDKIIKYEGLLDIYTDPETGIDYYSVIRYGPGCCGVDANCGFEIAWADGEKHEYPKQNEWCEVVGKLEIYEESGLKYLRINLISLTVLEKRGKETVTQ
jgi:uncharacterized membrane protein YcgQ (UPF0703/DUF1980 family)